MKQNENFLYSELDKIPYLLPYGQMIADHKRGLRTNAVGVYLWNLLEQERSLEEVLTLSAKHYEISEEELPLFREEITQFLRQLLSYNILVDTPWEDTSFCGEKQTILIGGLTIQLLGQKELFPPHFCDFITKEASPVHQTVWLHLGTPDLRTNGQLLLRSSELMIIEQEKQYLLLFPMSKHISELQLSKDASTVHCYCLPPYQEEFYYDLFHALRLAYLYLAQQHDMTALHSASILYRDRVWLFSGHSGMGKSTHTNLWNELYQTPVLNGDLNLLAIQQGCPVVHGIPWCGTSQLYDTKTYPLGGIILLNQSPVNYLESLTTDQKCLLTAQRLISPTWTKELWEKNTELIRQLTQHLLICKLHCTKTPEAVNTIKQEIDTYLTS